MRWSRCASLRLLHGMKPPYAGRRAVMAARRMVLMRVEYPLPYPFSQARTSRSSRPATNSLDLGRNADASCSSVSGGMSEKSISDSGAAASLSSDPRWRFVKGLLRIDSAFTLTSLSGRDDADEFFAIFCLPIDVNHDQQRLRRPAPVRASAARHSRRF